MYAVVAFPDLRDASGSGTTRLPMSDTPPAQPLPASSLEERLGHRFATPALLEEALTHPSWANMQAQRRQVDTAARARQAEVGPTGTPGGSEVAARPHTGASDTTTSPRPLHSASDGERPRGRQSAGDNQRLEFLGDAVVDLLVSERLFVADPGAKEGLLTERRAALVNERRLAHAARELGLGEHLKLAPGEERAGFRERPGVLADAFEAVTAAIFRDGGLEAARAFITRALPELERGRPARLKPAKARLQELTQERWKLTPTYAVLATGVTGVVEVEVRVGERLRGKGTGTSRREAENAAAIAALTQITDLARVGPGDQNIPTTEAPE